MNKRVLGLLFVTLFLVMVGFSVLFPVEAYYVKAFGATAREMGWLIMLYSLGQFLFSPLWGKLSDRVGRRPVLMLGLAGFSISMLLFGLSTQLWHLFVTRALAGILSAATLPTAMSVIADSTDDEHRARGMGFLGAAFGLGVIFGPALGGWLGRTDLSLPYFVTAGLALANLIWVYAALPETLPPGRRGRAEPAEPLRNALRPAIATHYFLSLLVSFALANLETTFGFLAADRLGLDPGQTGLLFVIMGIAGAVVQGGLIGRLKARFGESRLILAGLLISAGGLAGTGLVRSPLQAAFAVTFFSVGNGLIRPANIALITRKSSAGYGRAIGLLGSFDSMGRILGPLAAGYLYAVRDLLPFALGSGLCLLGFLLYLSLNRD